MVAPDDLDLALRAARSGDQNAFRRIYRVQQPALLRYLFVLVGQDADDIASETWLQITRDLTTFAGDWNNFRGWTATIARHRAMDSLRAAGRRPQTTTPIDHLPHPTALEHTADQALEHLATNDAVALIAALPRDQAEAVMLRAVLGLDAHTAATILGKRSGAVRTAAYRGLRRLAQHLDVTSAPVSRHPNAWTGVTRTAAPALKEVG